MTTTLDQQVDISNLPTWAQTMYREAWAEAKKRANLSLLAEYQRDPVRFGNEVLGHSYYSDVEDLMRSVVDNPVTVAKSGNAVGKSYSSADIALWWFSVYDDAKVFMTAAPPLENLKNILWGAMMRAVRLHPDLFKKFTIKELEIKRHDESFVSGVTIPMTGTSSERVSKFSGKHAPHLLFLVDEGDAVPPEVYEGIESCMSGGMARLLVMFNPKSQQGPIYQMEIDQKAKFINLSALRHPNVLSGDDIIPGAVTRETVVRRINQWT